MSGLNSCPCSRKSSCRLKPKARLKSLPLDADGLSAHSFDETRGSDRLSFVFQRFEAQQQCCTTRRQSIDSVVTTILATVRQKLPGVLSIKSDGGPDVFILA
ncbi:MAG: hypothetical protein WC505_06140 [Patescibacteria group bacterium]